MKKNDLLKASVAAVLIAGSVWFLWQHYFAAPKINVALHRGIGIVLAEETIRLLDNRGDVLVITMADSDSEILATQFAAFRERLDHSRVKIKDVELIASEKKDKYGPGVGLSASKLTREVKKNLNREAIVSFVGLPELDAAELPALGETGPRLLAFSRMPDKLGPLLQHGWVAAAIVPRFKFPTPGAESPRTPGEWFTNQYQVVASPAKLLPAK
jgi:hypothetical protein